MKFLRHEEGSQYLEFTLIEGSEWWSNTTAPHSDCTPIIQYMWQTLLVVFCSCLYLPLLMAKLWPGLSYMLRELEPLLEPWWRWLSLRYLWSLYSYDHDCVDMGMDATLASEVKGEILWGHKGKDFLLDEKNMQGEISPLVSGSDSMQICCRFSYRLRPPSCNHEINLRTKPVNQEAV